MLPRICLFFCVGMLIAVGVDVVTGFLRYDVFHLVRGRFADAGPVWRLQHLWFMNEFLYFIAILAGGIARDYFLRYHARREQTILLQAQAAQLQAQLADARLAALRTQLNPHFLFNTLHAVSALVERDPRGVRRMIARLSELLRTTLDGADEQEVPLGQELTFTHRYLEIMQIRFQGRLAIESQVEPGVLDALVPNLILQPLVENAIKHGVSKIDEEGRIEINARRDGDRLVLCVRDNGPRISENGLRAGEGVGLRNTRERLQELYGAEQSLHACERRMTAASSPKSSFRSTSAPSSARAARRPCTRRALPRTAEDDPWHELARRHSACSSSTTKRWPASGSRIC